MVQKIIPLTMSTYSFQRPFSTGGCSLEIRTEIWKNRRLHFSNFQKLILICFVFLIINSHFLMVEAKCGVFGRSILTSSEGDISDGFGSYSSNHQCEWLIQAPTNNSKIVLEFSSFETECSYDFIFVFDGDSHSSPLIASLSGNYISDVVVARSGKMLVILYSDTNYILRGFQANYRIQDCVMDCSNQGTCVNNVCVCDNGHTGEWCQQVQCPNSCNAPNGHCDFTSNICECNEGYVGEDCSLNLSSNDNLAGYYTLCSSFDYEFKGRTGHAGQFHEKSNSLWVFGGFNLYTTLVSMDYYNFTSNKWQTVPFQSDSIQPAARYGHTMTVYQDTVIVFGGSLDNGSLLNDLWQFNITSQQWTLLDDATQSPAPSLTTDHSAVLVYNTTLYIFGGVTSTFYSLNKMFTYDLTGRSGWQEVIPRGGHEVGVTGHTCVFDAESNSLIVFGGLHKTTARASTKSNDIYLFHLDKLYWYKLDIDDADKPRERAFHSANVIGNFMVVYGGYVHDHVAVNSSVTEAEICFSNEILLFHLGCYQWVAWNDILQDFLPENPFPVESGRFGHIAAVRDNVLLVTGGYRGTVLKDLIAIKMPGSVTSNMSQCYRHETQETCLVDPECGWCVTDQLCIDKTDKTNCINFQETCAGICPKLTLCESCTIWGQSSHGRACGWCVLERACQFINETSGRCDENYSETPTPWWESPGSLLNLFDQCRHLDKPPGITWKEFRYPVNESHPDKVSILSSTSVGFQLNQDVPNAITTGKAVFSGFIHPSGVSGLEGGDVKVSLKSSSATSSLSISTDASEENKELVASVNNGQNSDSIATRNNGDAVLPTLPVDGVYYVSLEVLQAVASTPIISWVAINWDCISCIGSLPYISIEIHDEFLQPYHSSSCDGHVTCLACLSDSSCSWCSDRNLCLLRNVTSDQCGLNSSYLITSPDYCEACSVYVNCLDCLSSMFCEWLPTEVQCVRRGRFQYSLLDRGQCPSPCHSRTNCSSCVTSSRECAWCEDTQHCFAYGAYTSIYKYGQCKHWHDADRGQCPDCSLLTSCSECLQSFRCGWCGNQNNPTLGNCHSGDFVGPSSELSCESLVAIDYNTTINETADWSYAECPPVEECRLGLDNCHENALCIDTDESFYCECLQGFIGDGSLECNRTCYYDCEHGHCSGPPDYECVCDVGWTNVNCSVSCGCNYHSTCINGTGSCDSCQDLTMGEFCELCVPGSYGDATTQYGCHDCACNNHGDPNMDDCDNITGVCFCIDNTGGDYCQLCEEGYYGDPRDGGKCYLECKVKLVITDVTSSTLGSHEGDGATNPEQTLCSWILTVFDDLSHPSPLTPVPTISLSIEEISLMCGRDYVYVYDGLPSSISNNSTFGSVHLASFCEANSLEKHTVVQATSGVMTVIFEADTSTSSPSSGFKAMFTVHDCPSGCNGNRECINGICVCQTGFGGVTCELELCPLNCSYSRGQGICNEDFGLCVCVNGFGGESCSEELSTSNAIWTMLFNSDTHNQTVVADAFPLGVMGHTMVVRDESMVVFGGYSFQTNSNVNSLWQYNLTTSSWSKVVGNQASKPPARHFHAAAYTADILYISGGIADSSVLNDFWAYDFKLNSWTELQAVTPLAGHTLTVVDDELFLIGGYSPENGFLEKFFVFDIPTNEWEERTSQGSPPTGLYGHSAVYHEQTGALYVFGGYGFHVDLVYASNQLYTLRPSEGVWSILPIESNKAPFSHVFHSAVSTDDYMLVIGGATEEHNVSSTLMSYSYQCNVWYDLGINNFTTGRSPLPASSVAAVGFNVNTTYVYGGYNGMTSGALYRLHIPNDLCAIYDGNTDECVKVPGCSACVTNTTSSTCASTGKISCSGSFDELVPGEVTCYDRIVNRVCEHAQTCSECLAVFPSLPNGQQPCRWCRNCTETTCVKRDKKCPLVRHCSLNKPSEEIVTSTARCTICEASKCETCLSKGCMWTRQYEQTGVLTFQLYTEPTVDWRCFLESLKDYVPASYVFQSSPPDACPTRCHQHIDCNTCLDSNGADGGWKECYWSRWLNECLSPSYLLLRCATGECGTIISDQSAYCPIPCYMLTICADCINTPGCGWCSVDNANGIGVCMEGGLFSPTGGVCQGNVISLSSGEMPAYMANYTDISSVRWSFLACPPENECLNGHAICGDTQICNDTQEAYLCTCRYGYEAKSPESCVPVCSPECAHGTCISPDVCDCLFGYVGVDCSIACNCNGHSHCSGNDEAGLNDCIHCSDNTMGNNCEYCQALFVGDPRDGGTCTNCTIYCHGNSDICLTAQEYNSTVTAGLSLTPELVQETFTNGPLENALCVNCSGYSSGQRCETCIDEYFKQNGICRQCECNGHWSTCNKETGLDCNCANNTRTPQCPDSLLQEPCYEHQCSKCTERYVGEPTNGHQCYLEMRVEQDYCFWSQTQCPINSEPLPYGRSSFFAVQPKFKNLDIRMTIDVTYGKLDVYVAFNHSIFTVDVNKTTGIHTVNIDGNVEFEKQSYRRRRDTDSDSYKYYEITASGLNTFLTVETSKFIVVVFDVQNRLVVTFPYMNHPLETGKFFVTLLGKSLERDNTTQGIMYYYQDQLHIDLFVFFSVFLACFFLLLALCVIVWQAKTRFETHRDHQERLIQMETMASRPFGNVMILIDEDEEIAKMALLKKQNQKDSSPPPLVRREEYNFHPGVMTSEMVDDGMANIGTLIITLPGVDIPSRACLGSALLTVKQYTSSYHTKEIPVPQIQSVNQKVIVPEESRRCHTRQMPRQVWQT
ncbi:multiple epidermal growth factor-like domains protein 8 [Antedon mediterranea]|uniref:multiple epidermal growth factor-like domains protein 8 n=1 Tax=Antedon mediterranea TaxID=105859 RepID=UPI003AF6FEC5